MSVLTALSYSQYWYLILSLWSAHARSIPKPASSVNFNQSSHPWIQRSIIFKWSHLRAYATSLPYTAIPYSYTNMLVAAARDSKHAETQRLTCRRRRRCQAGGAAAWAHASTRLALAHSGPPLPATTAESSAWSIPLGARARAWAAARWA